jgi:hypothetical protein
LCLDEAPEFIDIYGSTIAYILPEQLTSNKISIIDVGIFGDEDKPG